MQARDCKDVTDLIVTPPAARAVALRGREGGGSIEMGGDVANALRASSGGSDKEHVLAPIPLVELGCRTGRAGHEAKDGLGVGEADQALPVLTDIAPTMIVRRLMPVECERLQGFPEKWTFVPVGGKMAADGPRYKQLGNSWAVNCVRWYGARITAHLAEIERPAIEASATADDGMIVWMTAP
jgi:DNA (cytosine-5)-methyltransferase 1